MMLIYLSPTGRVSETVDEVDVVDDFNCCVVISEAVVDADDNGGVTGVMLDADNSCCAVEISVTIADVDDDDGVTEVMLSADDSSCCVVEISVTVVEDDRDDGVTVVVLAAIVLALASMLAEVT